MSVWTMLGGPVFWILALLGAASIFVFLSRLMNLRRAQIDYQDFMRGVATVLEQHNPDEALAICAQIDTWREKKRSEEAQAGYNAWLDSDERWENMEKS